MTVYHDGYKWDEGHRTPAAVRETFASASRPEVAYEAVLWSDLLTSCNCRGWATHKHCGHESQLRDAVRRQVRPETLRLRFYAWTQDRARYHSRPITNGEVRQAELNAYDADHDFYHWVMARGSAPPPAENLAAQGHEALGRAFDDPRYRRTEAQRRADRRFPQSDERANVEPPPAGVVELSWSDGSSCSARIYPRRCGGRDVQSDRRRVGASGGRCAVPSTPGRSGDGQHASAVTGAEARATATEDGAKT